MSTIKIASQYLKNLSFELGSTKTLLESRSGRPDVSVSFDITAQKLEEDHFEVSLSVDIKSSFAKNDLFKCGLCYSGIFNISGVEGETLDQLLLIYCPNILFPFLRRIISDVTSSGSLSPLMLDPIDFAALYTKRKIAENAQPVNDTEN